MKKYSLSSCLMFVMIFYMTNLISQSESSTRRKAVFIEFLGNGLLISGNFDMRFKKGQQDGLGFRAGFGGLTITGIDEAGFSAKAGIFNFPLELNYLVGKKRSAFEGGIGLTPLYLNAKLKIEDSKISGSGFGANGFISIGYRFQPLDKGFLFRINWCPIINSSGISPAWFGLSLGYSFK